MELRDYIDLAAKKAGNLTALGKMLDLSQPNISNIRAHRKALPDKQLVQLAEYLEIPEIELIRANNIAMGKHIDFWTTWGKVASICAMGLVTFFVTPSPAEASQTEICQSHDLYYVKSRMLRASKQRHLSRSILELFQGFKKALLTLLTVRTPKMQPI